MYNIGLAPLSYFVIRGKNMHRDAFSSDSIFLSLSLSLRFKTLVRTRWSRGEKCVCRDSGPFRSLLSSFLFRSRFPVTEVHSLSFSFVNDVTAFFLQCFQRVTTTTMHVKSTREHCYLATPDFPFLFSSFFLFAVSRSHGCLTRIRISCKAIVYVLFTRLLEKFYLALYPLIGYRDYASFGLTNCLHRRYIYSCSRITNSFTYINGYP